ncbi:MAG: hypothetical protein K0Q87_3697 [Neobacillus sp.]|nr:hypothetical protein [Neobacillus sp.]
MTKEQALRTLAPLVIALSDSRVTKDKIDVYATALTCLTVEQLTAAVLKCMRTCDYFPSIAEIMRQSENMVQVANGTQRKSVDEAWEEMCKQRDDCWPHKTPKFSTKEIEQTVSAMGWTSLCTAEEKDIGITRAQFRGFYESICKRKQTEKIDNDVLGLMGVDGIKMIK